MPTSSVRTTYTHRCQCSYFEQNEASQGASQTTTDRPHPYQDFQKEKILTMYTHAVFSYDRLRTMYSESYFGADYFILGCPPMHAVKQYKGRVQVCT